MPESYVWRERNYNHAILYIESKYSLLFFSQLFYDFRHLMVVISPDQSTERDALTTWAQKLPLSITKKRLHLSNQEAYKN